VRDFVHIPDLADANTRAIEHLLANGISRAPESRNSPWDNQRNC
jgi:UDP-glucose 4-epimerase